MVAEIHKSEKLSEWIQRQVGNRTGDIVKYLESQDQRFFNSLILGIYGGKPYWQEIEIKETPIVYDEKNLDYLDRTFGVLTLNGDEKIFAIDGQHRIKAIKEALSKPENSHLAEEEVAVIFLGHKETQEGRQRTRRLFTTLNRYAKPVSKSEIIALDEDDNCAVLTRSLVDDFELFKGKILLSKNKSINPRNKTAFTNIITIYDSLLTLLTDKRVAGTISVSGENSKIFTNKRVSDEFLSEKEEFIKSLFIEISKEIPVLAEVFYQNKPIERTDLKTSLLFRPIGMNIFFMVIKVAIENDFKDEAIQFFAKNDFSLNHLIWNKIFWNEEVENIVTNKTLQNFAALLILKKLGYDFNLTATYKEIFNNYNFNIDDI